MAPEVNVSNDVLSKTSFDVNCEAEGTGVVADVLEEFWSGLHFTSIIFSLPEASDEGWMSLLKFVTFVETSSNVSRVLSSILA